MESSPAAPWRHGLLHHALLRRRHNRNKRSSQLRRKNTFQDALASHRVTLGENATAIDLGLIAFTGAVADDAQLQQRVSENTSLAAMASIAEPEFHALLDIYCSPSNNANINLDIHTRQVSASHPSRTDSTRMRQTVSPRPSSCIYASKPNPAPVTQSQHMVHSIQPHY